MQRERLHAIGQLASGISHDFNNSLGIIIGYCDTLYSHIPSRTDEARLVTLLTRIRHAAHDGSILANRLYDFSKGVASPRQLRPLDLNAVIDHSRALASVHIEELQARGTSVSVVTSLRSVPLVLGDASELGSALMNLILNAFDAMANGGALTIETERQARFVRLTVRDTGIGMSDETRHDVSSRISPRKVRRERASALRWFTEWLPDMAARSASRANEITALNS
ncbi:MAG: hypothetical protein EXR45_01640 [Chloroflexi bacterium]|nr:hypothetical protein [Chloroflexota bacterium]